MEKTLFGSIEKYNNLLIFVLNEIEAFKKAIIVDNIVIMSWKRMSSSRTKGNWAWSNIRDWGSHTVNGSSEGFSDVDKTRPLELETWERTPLQKWRKVRGKEKWSETERRTTERVAARDLWPTRVIVHAINIARSFWCDSAFLFRHRLADYVVLAFSLPRCNSIVVPLCTDKTRINIYYKLKSIRFFFKFAL